MAKPSLQISVGGRYGLLTVESVVRVMKSGQFRRFADVLCECGVRKQVECSALVNSRTVSCGCASRESSRLRSSQMFRKHGLNKTSEHRIWSQAKQRCFNPNNEKFPIYGGRGITMCDRWKDSFENFMADMGPRPSSRHSIDRYPDNNGPYSPENCRWATSKEQRANQRPLSGRAI